MEPYCRAAISCGERGRDLRLSFWRRFWNHIYKARGWTRSATESLFDSCVYVDVWARSRLDALSRRSRTWTSFSLRDTRFTMSRRAALSGFGLALYAVSRMALSLALGCGEERRVSCVIVLKQVAGTTYAVLFLLPFGWRSEELLLWKDESGSALS